MTGGIDARQAAGFRSTRKAVLFPFRTVSQNRERIISGRIPVAYKCASIITFADCKCVSPRQGTIFRRRRRLRARLLQIATQIAFGMGVVRRLDDAENIVGWCLESDLGLGCQRPARKNKLKRNGCNQQCAPSQFHLPIPVFKLATWIPVGSTACAQKKVPDISVRDRSCNVAGGQRPSVRGQVRRCLVLDLDRGLLGTRT